MSVHIPPRPPVLDSVRLHEISLPLPAAPDPWHRDGKPQPCTATLKLSYSSAIAAASSDDVSLSLDYGKLFRRLDTDVRGMGSSPGGTSTDMVSIEGTQRPEMRSTAVGQDPRVTAGIVANCGLGLLDETAAAVRRMAHVHTSPRASFSGEFAGAAQQVSSTTAAPRSYPISADYGQCEVSLHLPKAILRAEEGLRYRSLMVWGYKQGLASEEGRCSVVLEEEFRIEGIRCHCILGVNSHERVEKQTVIVSLEFSGPGQLAWGSAVVDSYQAMARAVAENVEETSFQTVEALATFVARIATVEFGNERVTVRVEKPSALAFVQRSGVEITRTMDFFRS